MGRPPNHSSRRRRLTKPSRGRDGHGKRGRQNRAGRPASTSHRATHSKLGTGDSKVKAAHPARLQDGVRDATVVQGAPPSKSFPVHGERVGGDVVCTAGGGVPAPDIAPTRRTRTILLLEGINDRTNRPIRAYLRPDDTIVCVETLSSTHEQYTYPAGRIGEERREG